MAIAINLIYGLTSRNNREKYLTVGAQRIGTVGDALLLLLLMVLLYIAGTSKGVLDYDTYERFYVTGSSGIEVGYVLLEKIGIWIGLSFAQFRWAMYFMSFLIALLGIKKIGLNKNVAFSLYAIFPFTYDVIQIRNLIALSIVIYAISSLSTKGIMGKIKYVTLILIAGAVHSLALIYLILIITNLSTDRSLRRNGLLFAFCVSLGLALLMKISPNLSDGISMLVFRSNAVKGSAYTARRLNWGFLLYWMMQLGYILTVWILRKKDVEGQEEYGTWYNPEKLFWLNLCIACTFPLCVININFYRIYRNLSLLNYGMLALVDESYSKTKRFFSIFVFVATFILNAYIGLSIDYKNVFEVFFIQ